MKINLMHNCTIYNNEHYIAVKFLETQVQNLVKGAFWQSQICFQVKVNNLLSDSTEKLENKQSQIKWLT